ncbi:MAG: PH domain-containing protein [Candidatus Aenigmarchaeota archaeon]|nr:PH domain-containing protein [Candidatus Aenigmarchaeota archaeon]
MKVQEKGLRYKTVRISYVQNYFIIILLLVLIALLLPALDSWWSKLMILCTSFIVLILLLEPEAERVLREYLITNSEVTKIEGIIIKKRISIPYQSVADVRVIKGIAGRIFNFGTVVVKGMKDDIVVKGIKEPEVVYRIIENKIARMKGLVRLSKEKQ